MSGTVAGTAQGGHADSRSGSRRPKPPITLSRARGAWEAQGPAPAGAPARPARAPREKPAGAPPAPRGEWGAALTGAQEALRQPSEAARVVRRSIFHVGAEAQRGRGGEGEACASGPPRGLAATSCAGAEAGAVPAGAREARGARAAGGGAEREPGRRRQAGPGAGREQQTQERRGEEEPPLAAAAAAAGTAAGGDAQGSCLRSSAAASIAAASSSRRCALPSWELRGEVEGR